MLEARRRIGLFLGAGVLCALLAAWIVHSRVVAVEAQLGKWVRIYVAAHPIPAQAPLASADITTALIPARFLQPGMVTDPNEVTGKVSLVPLVQGDLLTRNMLTQRVIVPDGHRILRLYRSDVVLFDENLLVGDRVDLVTTYTEPGETPPRPVTRTYLSNLPVMESDTKGAWVGLLVREADATGVIYMQNFARQIQLLRLSPAKGGVSG